MSEMFLTTKKPDRPGWWWCKGDCAFPVCIVQRGSRLVEAAKQETDSEIRGAGWLWSSEPIPEPSEPTEHPLVQEIRDEADMVGKSSLENTKCRLNKLADKLQAALSGKDA